MRSGANKGPLSDGFVPERVVFVKYDFVVVAVNALVILIFPVASKTGGIALQEERNVCQCT
jgi:hypothetical protein